jgi:hypothetical protein
MVTEGDYDDVLTRQTNKGTRTCVTTDSPIVIRVPTKRRIGAVTIKTGADCIETLGENFKFRITPSETEMINLEITLKDGSVSELVVRTSHLE